MSDQERYVKYIEAHRSGNKEVIDKMLSEGFRPDRQRLMEYARKDKAVRETLFNKKIKVRIDVGHMVGHVYGDFPYYDEIQDKIIEGTYGYYPSSELFPKALMGPGVVRDEVRETRRMEENLPMQEMTLPLTEESWIKLAHWITRKRKEKDYYLLVGKNCAHFVDMALREAGYEDGLLDKFDPLAVQKLNFRLIKLEIAEYFRYDKRKIYESHIQISIPIIEEEVVCRLSRRAGEERAVLNGKSHGNHVNAFFDKYHDAAFYQAYFKNKPLTMEDLAWLIRNRAPGLEHRIHSGLIHVFAEAPDAIQQQYAYSPEFFISHMVRTLGTDPKLLDPNIQKLLAVTKVDYFEDEIAIRYRRANSIQFFRVPRAASRQQAQYLRVMIGFGEEVSPLIYTSALDSLKRAQDKRDLEESLKNEGIFQDCLRTRELMDCRMQVRKSEPMEPAVKENQLQPVMRRKEHSLDPSLIVSSLPVSSLKGISIHLPSSKLNALQKRAEIFKQEIARQQQIMPCSYTPRLWASFERHPARQEPMVYNCPPPYAKLPLFKALNWKKEHEMPDRMRIVIVYNPANKNRLKKQ